MEGLTGETQERKIWHQLDGESKQAYDAFCVYRDLPRGERTLDTAFHKLKSARNATGTQQERNKRADGTWTKWYTQFQWSERAKARDEYLQQVADEEDAANIRQILNSSYALQHERVKILCEVAESLKDDVLNKHYLKSVITTKDGTTIESEIFNEGVFRVFDKLLESIAKEKGDRSTKKLEVRFNEMSNEQIARFILTSNAGQK